MLIFITKGNAEYTFYWLLKRIVTIQNTRVMISRNELQEGILLRFTYFSEMAAWKFFWMEEVFDISVSGSTLVKKKNAFPHHENENNS